MQKIINFGNNFIQRYFGNLDMLYKYFWFRRLTKPIMYFFAGVSDW
jgi:hypothetical protein